MTTSLPSARDDGYDDFPDDSGSGASGGMYDGFLDGGSVLVDDAEPAWALAASEAEWRTDLLRAGASRDLAGADTRGAGAQRAGASPAGAFGLGAGAAGADPAAARGAGTSGFSFVDAARALSLFDPALLAREAVGGAPAGFADANPDQARALLVAGVVAAQRLVNHYQAVQHRWIAALARPGVTVPLEALVDVVTNGGNTITVPGASEEDLLGDPARLLDDPKWAPALHDAAARIAAAEIAPALTIAPRTAGSKVAAALDLVDALPAVLAAHESGLLDGYRVSIIADQTALLEPARRAAVASVVLPAAASRTPSRLRDILKREIIAADPGAAHLRATAAHEQRDVTVQPAEDDMGTIIATVGIADAHLIHSVLDQAARNLTDHGTGLPATSRPDTNSATGPGGCPCTEDKPCPGGDTCPHANPTGPARDLRTLAQRRADILTDIFTSLAHTGHASLHAPCAGECTSRGCHEHTGTTHGADTSSSVPAHRASGTGSAPVETADGDTMASANRGDSGQPAGRAARGSSARTTCLNVYMDADTALGIADNPAAVTGMGIITAHTARALAASATTIRALITQPAPEPNSPPGENAGIPPGPSATLPARKKPAPPGGVADEGKPGDTAEATASLEEPCTAGAPARPVQATSPSIQAIPAIPSGHSPNPARNRVCDTVVDAGRAVYVPPARVADYVTARDATCQWPGCRTAAETCDLDHRQPYNTARELSTAPPDRADAIERAGGEGRPTIARRGSSLTASTSDGRPPETPARHHVTHRDNEHGDTPPADTEHGGATCACNLDALCRHHHRLKTFTTWTANPNHIGRLTWTTPTGQTHTTEPGHALLDHGTDENTSPAEETSDAPAPF